MVENNSVVRQNPQMSKNIFRSAYFYGISSSSPGAGPVADRQMIESLSRKVSKNCIFEKAMLVRISFVYNIGWKLTGKSETCRLDLILPWFPFASYFPRATLCILCVSHSAFLITHSGSRTVISYTDHLTCYMR